MGGLGTVAQGGGNDIRWLGEGEARASVSVVIFYILFNAVTSNHNILYSLSTFTLHCR